MKFDRKYLWGLIPLALIVFIVYYFIDIFTYIILAWVVSMITAPLMKLLLKMFSRNIAAVLTLMSFGLFLVTLISLFIPPLFQQAKNLSDVDYAKVMTTLSEPINDWSQYLGQRGLFKDINANKESDDALLDRGEPERFFVIDTLVQQTDSIQNKTIINLQINLPDEAEDSEEEPIYAMFRESFIGALDPSNIPKFFSSVVGFLGNLVITILSVFFIAFFFLREQGLFGKMITSVLPTQYDGRLMRVVDESSALLIRYFGGIVIQICIITVIVSLSLRIMDVKNALLIGFFAAVINVIPYLGPILGATFGLLITVSSNLSADFYDDILPQGIIILIVFACIQLLDNFILQPTIFSKSVKAHPLEIFIVILIGAKIAGIVGMVLAIPLYTVIRIIAKTFFGEFRVIQKITANL